MKNLLISFTLLIFLISCNSTENVVEDFYDAYNSGNGRELLDIATNDIRIVRNGEIVCPNQEALYIGFQCDSVLSARIEILEIESQESIVNVTISKSSEKLQFLQDTTIVYKARIKVNKHKIAEIEIYEDLLLDMDKLNARQDSLINWINDNHPELSGFGSGESIKKAQDYLKAIELYGNIN